MDAERRRERGVAGFVDDILGRYGLWLMLIVAFVSHGWNMFYYPQYLGDEGIYMEQAWALLRRGELSPYTYFYDHAPAGWLLIAFWVLLLPAKFATWGMAINSGRVLMLLIHLVSTALLFSVSRRLAAGSPRAAILVCLVFSLSPLALYYQRMVLLDNIMVLWMLLALWLLLHDRGRLFTLAGSGAAFGLAMLTKENAIFFAPILGYLLYHNVRKTYRFRFAIAGFSLSVWSVVSTYVLLAVLKGELFPDTPTEGKPAEHVSLIGTILWQLGRSKGSILDPDSLFWQFSLGRWWPKDPLILVVGATATFLMLLIGVFGRGEQRRHDLAAAFLSLAYAFYLARGSVMLEFYVVPLLPFLALNIGMVTDRLLRHLGVLGILGFVVAAAAIAFLAVRGSHDHYTLNLTQVQAKQLAYIRQNLPPDARMVIDDDLWVDLHEARGRTPVFRNAHSHWKVVGDPAIRDEIFEGDWRNIDYLIMSNKLYETFQIEGEQLVLDAYAHSDLVAFWEKGNVRVEVRKVNP